MGIEAAILGPVLGATIGTAGSFITQSANASAQSSINKKTMAFNREEAQKARDFSAAQAVIDRQFNSAQAAAQRQFAAEQGAIGRTYDAQQALLAREFEERMSSSAHQREVNDLRLAGLNPVLSATGGSGASTPVAPVIGAPAVTGASANHSGSGSAQASVSGLNAYMKQDILSKFVNSAMEGMRLNNETKKAEAEDISAHARMLDAQTGVKRQAADEKKINKQIEQIDSDIRIAFEDLDIRKELKNADIDKAHALIDELYSKIKLNASLADKADMETREMEKKVRYGAFFATYLPEKVGQWFESNFMSFVKKYPDVLTFFGDKCGGDFSDPKKASEAAMLTYEKFKDLFGSTD